MNLEKVSSQWKLVMFAALGVVATYLYVNEYRWPTIVYPLGWLIDLISLPAYVLVGLLIGNPRMVNEVFFYGISFLTYLIMAAGIQALIRFKRSQSHKASPDDAD